jgi:p-hydroxybenzoate 3-monooxygenase
MRQLCGAVANMQMRTQVGIVGAGPAGLLLSQLLDGLGIDSVIVEQRSRDYIEHRLRAGVLEQGTADLLVQAGVGARMKREGLVHRGIELRFGGEGHRIDLSELTGGRAITVYGQQEVVKDLIRARPHGNILFEAEDVRLSNLDSPAPSLRCRKDGEQIEIACEIIAGCDGFHGICRESIPAGALEIFERSYPFAWLGMLVHAPPPADELVYVHHERGFALFSMRSPDVARLYIQVPAAERVADWPDERVWEELHARLDGGRLNEGPVVEKGITGMRSYVVEPMQYGRLFLAGDAAHIVPPTGAKGLNLAAADVRVLAPALARFLTSGNGDLLETYSQTCLKRVWRAEHFSWWMTSMLHRSPGDDAFQQRLQRSQLEYVVNSRAAATSLAENYVG